MLLVIYYWLFVICYLLFVICYLLSVICDQLFVISYWLSVISYLLYRFCLHRNDLTLLVHRVHRGREYISESFRCYRIGYYLL
ncbi:hypothetical protein QT995_10245 [Microcoleus sp. S36b_A3]